MRKLLTGGVIVYGVLTSVFTLLIIGRNIRYEIQVKKTLSNFAESKVIREHLSNGTLQKDLECYPEAGTTILRVSCLGISYEVSNEVCKKLKSELLQKDEQCDSYE